MAQGQELDRLEGFVSRLLARYKALKEENERLTEELVSRDEVIGRLRQDLSSVDGERSEISDKISKMIAKIEQWEDELTTLDEAQQPSEKDGSRLQGSLFALNSNSTKIE